MPFLQEGGSVESDLVGGPVGSGLPPARLVVDPDKVLALKHGFEAERDRVQEWIAQNRSRLGLVLAPGDDPCSKDTAKALGENGIAAIDAAWGYANQLKNVAEALGEIANAYGLTEDENARRLGRRTR